MGHTHFMYRQFVLGLVLFCLPACGSDDTSEGAVVVVEEDATAYANDASALMDANIIVEDAGAVENDAQISEPDMGPTIPKVAARSGDLPKRFVRPKFPNSEKSTRVFVSYIFILSG